MPHNLYMLLLGGRPKGRNIEQHDIFFGIAQDLKELIPEIKAFWKGGHNIHIDAIRIVKKVDDYNVSVVENNGLQNETLPKIFFLNLGGYKAGHFEEFHYKMLTAASGAQQAAHIAKQTAFFLHTGFDNATAHIDNRYGVDVDDIFEIKDILSPEVKSRFSIVLTKETTGSLPEDEMLLGYFPLNSL